MLTAKQRQSAPYVVLVNPARTRGAAYNSRHQLLVGDVSADLLAFALTKHTQTANWVDDLDDPPRLRAGWMPEGSLAGWHLYWVRSDSSTAEHLRALPER